MLATIRSRLHRAAQRGQVKRASAAYVVTDGIIRAAQGMRKQAQEPQNMPVPRAGNWRQYLPADPLLVATLQGKRLSGNTSRRVMDFGRADKPNALQSFPQFSWEISRPKYPTEKYLGTRELPFKPRPSASAPWQFHAPKTDEFGVPKFKLDTKDYARDMSPADRAMTLGVLADVSPFPPTRVAARLNALALAPAVHKRWSQETSARDYVDWLTAQRQQK